jgi:hypothetical protein
MADWPSCDARKPGVGGSTKPYDLCVVTTIHRPYDVRIFHRELLTLAEAGFTVCLVSPWKRPEGWPPEGWVSMSMPLSRWSRIGHGARTFLAAMRVRSRSYLFHDLDIIP